MGGGRRGAARPQPLQGTEGAAPKAVNAYGAPGYNSQVHKPGYRRLTRSASAAERPFAGFSGAMKPTDPEESRAIKQAGLPGPLGGSGPPIEVVRERGPESPERNA